jgi:hypothetical protein
LFSFVGIIAHYLSKDLVNKNILISMRKIKSTHINENIIEVIISMLMEMEIVSRLEYFIADNAPFNNVC